MIELLVTVAILGILLTLLIPTLGAVQNHVRRATARKEVKDLKMALNSYYQVYAEWPNTVAYGNREPESFAVAIRDRMSQMLQGKEDGSNNNVRRIAFIEFRRREDNADPVNPWGSTAASRNTYEHYYYAKFDTDGDHAIKPGGCCQPNLEPIRGAPGDLIVWTYDPTAREGAPGHLIGSW